MKRDLFDFLTTDLQFVKGVGPILAARFDDILGGRRVLDFLLHRPSGVRRRDMIDNLADAPSGDTVTAMVHVGSHKVGGTFRRGRRAPTQVICTDRTGNRVTIQFFNVNFLDYWLKKLPVGEYRVISGKLDRPPRGGMIINHPEFIETPDDAAKIPAVQAIYPAGEGLTQKTFANVRDQIFDAMAPHVADADDQTREFFDALRAVHFPTDAADVAPGADARVKLAYYELLAHQSAIAITRRERRDGAHRRPTRPHKYDLMDKFYGALPFELTGAQQRAIDDIRADMAGATAMHRLVQGDVGSGKTMVALGAAVAMAETGAQTVLMAPTDTLAQQHFAKLAPLCATLGLVCDVLTGRDKGAARREKLVSIRSGRTRLVVGTHALFSDDVIYKDLGLVIIDEQHRFGVSQRTAMRAKGNNPDLLALSATPIPRTLSMTIYGDMDVSIVNEKPAGRLPIKTSKLPMDRIGALVGRIGAQIDAGAKVFWVTPLVTDSDDSDMTAAVARHDSLKKFFPTAGLVHGQMDKKQRDQVMEKFAADNMDMPLLVATTVIEVGIDVPRATIMVIENAERFGLAALHQLRGRVGRGAAQSYCILLYGNGISEDGAKRLDVLCETDDGFAIAEQDLMMRGTGELLGTRQSGWIQYHFVDYREHRDLFKLASRAAMDMTTPDTWVRDLMFIFDRQTVAGA